MFYKKEYLHDDLRRRLCGSIVYASEINRAVVINDISYEDDGAVRIHSFYKYGSNDVELSTIYWNHMIDVGWWISNNGSVFLTRRRSVKQYTFGMLPSQYHTARYNMDLDALSSIDTGTATLLEAVTFSQSGAFYSLCDVIQEIQDSPKKKVYILSPAAMISVNPENLTFQVWLWDNVVYSATIDNVANMPENLISILEV